MERLTDSVLCNEREIDLACRLRRCDKADVSCADCENFQAAIDRLAAYEDTGLTPQEVQDIAFWRVVQKEHSVVLSPHDVDEILRIMKSEKNRISKVVITDPTISPDEVRGVGEWIEDVMRIKCSVCGTDFNDEVTCCSDCYRWPWDFCPVCGAKMEVADDV